jgi:long-chain acyl-CoA synthetase
LEIRIGDPEGHTLAADELGEVLVRGDVVMAGYWEDPETNLQTLRGGWLHTGDLGSMDVDSFLTIKDRAKDMIISGGFNIYPREIEEILLRHPDVIEASVIGRVHPDYVEEVVACVVKRPDSQLTSKDLDELCLDHIARFKRPRDYVVLSELPKGYYGKVEKRQLRDQLAAARAQPQGNPSPQTESRR